jgi:hypothetical protein
VGQLNPVALTAVASVIGRCDIGSMADDRLPKVYEFEGGDVAVWYDGCVCIKAKSPAPHNDPVEMSDEEAVALAETLLRLVKENG